MLKSAVGRLSIAAAIAIAVVGTVAVTLPAARPAPVYVTWSGIGPDKWASVWLLRRHLSPESEIVFTDVNADLDPQATAFDIPGSAYMRQGETTTYETLLNSALADPDISNAADLRKIGAIINEMEVSRWTITATSETGMVEDGFRNLQFRYDRDAVPFACYMAYFDSLEAMLERNDGVVDVSITDTNDRLCDVLAESGTTQRDQVTEMPARDVLAAMGQGSNIVFVDTREKAEFDEFHIPGAVHMPLRDLTAERLAALSGADLVIPYCVKDFRGYEVARAMATHGVDNVAILNPYGIRGWRNANLPTTGSLSPLDETQAHAALAACAADPDSCLAQ